MSVIFDLIVFVFVVSSFFIGALTLLDTLADAAIDLATWAWSKLRSPKRP